MGPRLSGSGLKMLWGPLRLFAVHLSSISHPETVRHNVFVGSHLMATEDIRLSPTNLRHYASTTWAVHTYKHIITNEDQISLFRSRAVQPPPMARSCQRTCISECYVHISRLALPCAGSAVSES